MNERINERDHVIAHMTSRWQQRQPLALVLLAERLENSVKTNLPAQLRLEFGAENKSQDNPIKNTKNTVA